MKILTEIGVEKEGSAPKNKRKEVYDSGAAGLALRVTDKGSKSWSVYYRANGAHKRITLPYRAAGKNDPEPAGDVIDLPVYKLKEARAFARWATGLAKQGVDPKEERERMRAEARLARHEAEADSVGKVVKKFLAKHASTLRSSREVKRIFDVYILPAVTGADPRPWEERPVESIRQRDVIDLLDGVQAPFMRNRVLAQARKFLNWCAAQAIVDSLPAFKGLATRETSRDRVFSDAEIKEFWKAASAYPFGAALRFALVTGARRSEVTGLTWREIDTDKKIWTIPSERAKNGVRHELPLSGLALEILESVPRFKDKPFVFSTTGGEKGISGLSKPKDVIHAAMVEALDEVDPWRIHDLRRTCGTGLQGLRIDRDVIGAVLNHAKGGGATPVYMRAKLEKEKCKAMTAWGRRLKTIIGAAPGNVVSLRG